VVTCLADPGKWLVGLSGRGQAWAVEFVNAAPLLYLRNLVPYRVYGYLVWAVVALVMLECLAASSR
jgi:hypothetical protein